jgi:hypothetical protein
MNTSLVRFATLTGDPSSPRQASTARPESMENQNQQEEFAGFEGARHFRFVLPRGQRGIIDDIGPQCET